MKNKIISISIILIFLFITLISVDAAAPSPRVDLNDYGISYSGRACNGDVLSVNYNKPSVIGGIQTVNVRGICEDGVVFPCPIPAHQNEYTNSGILCISQAEGSLTFECKTIPSQDITVSVVQL